MHNRHHFGTVFLWPLAGSVRLRNSQQKLYGIGLNLLSIEELQFEAIMPGNLDFADLHNHTAGISGALNLCSEYQNPNVSTGSDCP